MTAARSPQTVDIRPATPADVSIMYALVQELATYEKLSHEVTGTPEALRENLFGDRPYAEAVVARAEGAVAGFALFFHNFSTFLMQPGLYLEDLYVRPAFRRQGVGTALLNHLAELAVQRGCGRFEWSVLEWNQPAIAFYQRMGAEVKSDWRICRVSGPRLAHFGAELD
ncbi:MAG: GNAT family N-acetyltransferase [Cyanobacteria bacterium P01_H01_bin.119]